MRLPLSSFLDFVVVCPTSTSWCRRVGFNFHRSVLHAPGVSEDAMQHVAVPAFPLCFASRCCATSSQLPCRSRCVSAYACRVRAGTRSTISQRVSDDLKSNCSPNAAICWFEWLSSSVLVLCRPVASHTERRQCPSCTPHKSLQNYAVKSFRLTDLSFREVLDCTSLSLDLLVGSLNASIGVAVSDMTFFVDDVGLDVPAGFVFGVGDAGRPVA